jgi:hypothetical protein
LALLIVVNSLSAFAYTRKSTLFDKFVNEKCHILVTKDIIFPYGKNQLKVGSASLFVRRIDKVNNRRLKAGRLLKFHSVDDVEVNFTDNSIASMCFKGGDDKCVQLYSIYSERFDEITDNSLQIKCNINPTIDF